MAVKIRKKRHILGREVLASTYLPVGQNLSKERRDKADQLDRKLIQSVSNINNAYAELDATVQKNDFAKWTWLGNKLNQEIDRLIKDALLEQADVDNNAIWPAFGQYMRAELNRGVETKRSGTPRDHYRKCWLLARTSNTDWITTWTGWDAFVDRGTQLVGSKKLMPILEKKLKGTKLGKDDYQKLARDITNELPSTGQIASIAEMSDEHLEALIHRICKRLGLGSNSAFR